MSNLPGNESLCATLRLLAGYLNFSSGHSDAATLAAWNTIYSAASGGDPLSGPAAWLVVHDWMAETLSRLQREQDAFRDPTQASRVISLLCSELLPAYFDFHRDLLFHQEPELIFNGFFMARAADAMLAVGIDGDDTTVVQAAIDRLDDFVGYRPVAVLANQDCQPYRHEFVRPVPLYVRGAGVAAGPYEGVITRAIEILRDTDDQILQTASFDPERLAELALDPRAYDFDHPVNRRPNYHFGGWDERQLDSEGYFERFVVRQVTLDALLSRVAEEDQLDRDQLLEEAATVLAGTILMAAGISGAFPGHYSSEITIAGLMKPIAQYRDAYYESRFARLAGDHAQRLAAEQQQRRQPFGAARQHLNAALAGRRAAQVQHAQLARLYARMGFPDAALRQADAVAAASARMMCRIDCVMTQGLRRLRSGDLAAAIEVPQVAFDLLQRAIDCGALIDPWCILGFGGNFSLYPGPESSVHDTRIDDMLYLVEQLFAYIARAWSEAAARDDAAAYDRMQREYHEIAQWWRGYAAHTVESIEATDPLESYESAGLVARALRLWHQGGAESGNVAFWASHAELFDSPRAYALVISALLEREDFVSAMALLVHWLSHAERVGISSGGSSLPRLSERWLLKLRQSTERPDALFGQPGLGQRDPSDTREIWPRVRKFFDYYEANAEQFWSAPRFQLGKPPQHYRNWDQELLDADLEAAGDDELDDEPESGLFDAAYEGMTYRDTTDDGHEGAIFEFADEGSRDELEAESKRLLEHLSFLRSLARMWVVAADVAANDHSADDLPDRREALAAWADRTRQNRIGLLELLDAVRQYRVEPAGSDKESMRSYDRRRVLRDSLMEQIISAAVEMSDARRLIWGALLTLPGAESVLPDTDELAEDDRIAVELFGALIAGDSDRARRTFPLLVQASQGKNLLYIPLSRGGDPVKIYVARLRRRVLQHLMHWMPRRGLLAETCQLIDVAREMEQASSIGMGAVTEFDGLFREGFQSLVASLVESTRQAHPDPSDPSDLEAEESPLAHSLIPLLEKMTEITLGSWLAHSQTLRLSPLESVTSSKNWEQLVQFVQQYGDPVFTQAMLQLGNIRAILHQGVAAWLQRVIDQGDEALADTELIAALERGELSIDQASRWLTLVYESLIDHHSEYLDYNSTTTQSDRGELIYMFLDFLRLRVRYERIAWNLKPVMWAHEVLVRCGLDQAALLWRRNLSERIGAEAEVYVRRLRELQSGYAMRMPTVADRIYERFVQPMTIDRMRALVGPAMRDAEENRDSKAFFLLEQECELMTRHPTGVGLDVPAWLHSLEAEVEQLAKRRASSEIDPDALMTIGIVPTTLAALHDQLATARSKGRRLPHWE